MTAQQHKRGIVATALIVAALSRAAYGEPTDPPAPGLPPDFWHIRVPWHLTTDSGTKLDLPPGYFIDEPLWNKLDAEVKRLQDQETRLTAENKVLKTDVEGWRPGWVTLASAVVTGIVVGWYAEKKL